MTNFMLTIQMNVSMSKCSSSPSNHIVNISSWKFQRDFRLNSWFSLFLPTCPPIYSCTINYSVMEVKKLGVIFDISSPYPIHLQNLLNLSPKYFLMHSLLSSPPLSQLTSIYYIFQYPPKSLCSYWDFTPTPNPFSTLQPEWYFQNANMM